MRKDDGLVTSSPRNAPTLLDADILYRDLFCHRCGIATRHIHCDLLAYSGLGYACHRCGTEQAPDGQKTKKRGGSVRRVDIDSLSKIDDMLNNRHQLVYLTEDQTVCYTINRDTRKAAPYLVTIESSSERIYIKRYRSLESLVASEPFDLSKFSYERK